MKAKYLNEAQKAIEALRLSEAFLKSWEKFAFKIYFNGQCSSSEIVVVQKLIAKNQVPFRRILCDLLRDNAESCRKRLAELGVEFE